MLATPRLLLLSLVLAACAGGPPSTAPLPPADAAEYAATLCTATDELFLAIGNPDAGVPSASWKAFEDAIEAGDVAALDRAGTTVLAHLDAARTANARGATFPPGTAANAELEALLVAVDTYVRAVLEARGDKAVASAAEAAAGPAWERHWPGWLSALQALGAAGVPIANLPCATDEPRA